MTPRKRPSPPVDKAAETSQSGSDEDEERPTHTSEIGTLKKLPDHGTAWLGSSSGVYFVNTVRRAFSAAFAASHALPASEDILTGEDAEGRSYNGPMLTGPATTDTLPHLLSASLGKLPDRRVAMELVTNFFKAWHPVFPFLHGPSFLKDMEALYQAQRPTPPTFSEDKARRKSASQAATPDIAPPDVRKMVTFQLIINIALLDRTDIHLPPTSRINSTVDVIRVAGALALDHSLATIQTLLAAQLYLVATLAIRAASTVGGMIVKLIYHAGLHRCPLRYAQLSLEDCEIRKRIFWAAYALDRHCSLSLGDPNTIQDNDIDVCLSGRELHKAVARDLLVRPDQEINLHMARPDQRVGGLASGPVEDDPRVAADSTPEAKEKSLREAALISYVHWSRLTGRIIEIFHKSINHRFPKQDAIMYLTSDIETWWNDIPSLLTDPDPATLESAPHLQCLASFFKILYHRLHLLISRPRLSLDQSTPEFQHGLQICIRASRNILAGLKSHQKQGQSMFLPGLLSAAWMSGLIIAFACQLGKYPKARACADIHACLSLLTSMNLRWYTVGNCHKVLSLLLSNIESRKASTNGLLAVPKPDVTSPASEPVKDDRENGTRPKKRQRTKSTVEKTADLDKDNLSPKTVTDGTNSNQSSPNFSAPLPPTDAAGKSFKNTPSSVWSNSSLDKPYDLSLFANPPPPSNNTSNFNPNPSGSAVYANPQEMAYTQSNMGLPELPDNSGMNGGMEDPMFWGNIDFNMVDVFGSATWETMTGPFAPGWDFGGAGETFGTSNSRAPSSKPTSNPTNLENSDTQISKYGILDPKDDQLVQQLLGAAHLAMSDREAVLGKEGLSFEKRKGDQENALRDDTLDYMKRR